MKTVKKTLATHIPTLSASYFYVKTERKREESKKLIKITTTPPFSFTLYSILLSLSPPVIFSILSGPLLAEARAEVVVVALLWQMQVKTKKEDKIQT